MKIAIVLAVLLSGCGSAEPMLTLEQASAEWADGWCVVEAACGETVPCRWSGWAEVFREAWGCNAEIPAEWVAECRAAIEAMGCSDDVPGECQDFVCY